MARWTRLVLPAGVFVGLLLPPLASWLNPLVAPSVALLLVAGMIRIDWPALRAALARPGGAVIGILWLTAGMPLLAALATGALDLPDGLGPILVMVAAMPPILSGPALAGLLGLDAAAALVVVVVATLVAPLSLPVVGGLLHGAVASTDPAVLFLRMGGIVGGAVALTFALRHALGAERLRRRRPEVEGFGVLLLLVFAIGVMDGMAARLLAEPGTVLVFTLAAFAMNLGMQLVTRLAFRPAGARIATTVAFLAGNRNAALLLAVLPAEPALLLYVAVAQFPIYLLPSLMVPVYRRLAGAPESP